MIPWALLAVLAIAMFRPPRVDAWWAWAAWFTCCAGLIIAAAAITVASSV